jgi:Asp-tRNA(Asn)/Glu-tRNA(Gln) amidotransferase A subunit family amidase
MNREDIIRMAQETGVTAERVRDLERFAKLVAQHERDRIKQANAPEIERVNAHIKELKDAVLAEREACAKLCEDSVEYAGDTLAQAIRARGKHEF